MTSQEALKRRIRERMSKTGERYTAARSVVLGQSANRKRTWVSDPELPDDKTREATGRGWDEWCDVIEAWDGRSEARRELIIGHETVLRSKPTSKALRVAFDEGAALFSFDAAANGRTRITVSHEKLPSSEAADRWRFYWTEWLDALA